jgi:hypothetical protein
MISFNRLSIGEHEGYPTLVAIKVCIDSENTALVARTVAMTIFSLSLCYRLTNISLLRA